MMDTPHSVIPTETLRSRVSLREAVKSTELNSGCSACLSFSPSTPLAPPAPRALQPLGSHTTGELRGMGKGRGARGEGCGFSAQPEGRFQAVKASGTGLRSRRSTAEAGQGIQSTPCPPHCRLVRLRGCSSLSLPGGDGECGGSGT